MKTTELVDKLAANLKPVTPLPSLPRRLMVWGSVLVIIFTGLLCLVGARSNLREVVFTLGFVGETLLLVFAAVLSAAVAFTMSVPGRERSYTRYIPVAVLGVLICALLVFSDRGVISQNALDILKAGHMCCLEMLILSIVPCLVIVWMLRLAAPIRRAWTLAVGFMSSALFAAVFMQFTCSSTGVGHLLLTHMTPVALTGIAGALLGRRILRWELNSREPIFDEKETASEPREREL